MPEFVIASCVLPDVDRLYEIECACFHTPWSKTSLVSFIEDSSHTFCLAARTEGLESNPVIGYIGVMYVLDEGEICNIAVYPESRGQGAGRSLLEAALAYCRQIGIHTLHLEVRLSNLSAISLYKKFGFVPTGKRPGYYQDNGEDALLFTWIDVS
jgi:ribosomal-protein-alanine N-acetyltransferase